MDDDQQFCLRWNNHQSTLISVFDTLLEKGVHVDCTLAAEGRTLRAHKVVLSACSPYFEAVLGQQYDKHPIIILKDVKFAELRAMMDYMYRGEVNISQDQLGALLKAAESLQIKGLSDSKPSAPPPLPTLPALPAMPALPPQQPQQPPSNDVDHIAKEVAAAAPAAPERQSPPKPEEKVETRSREGSESPQRRKRRRRATPPPPRYPTPPTAAADCFEADRTPARDNDRDKSNADNEHVEPKAERDDDSIEDLTVDEDADSDAGPGSSRSRDGTVRGAAWQPDRSGEEQMIVSDSMRDAQDVEKHETERKSEKSSADKQEPKRPLPCAQYATPDGVYTCPNCRRIYNARKNLVRHINLECGRPPQYKCPVCPHGNHRRNELRRHILKKHPLVKITRNSL